MGIVVQKTALRNCLEWLNICPFRCPVADHYTEKLTVGAAIILFVEGQLQQRKSLPDICLNLKTNTDLQELIGFSSIDPSSLFRKLEAIPLHYLTWLFSSLAQQLKEKMSEAKGIKHFGKLSPVDSTTLSLPAILGKWAYFQKHNNGVKIHTRLLSLESDCHFPDEIVLSTAGVSDQQAVHRLVTQKDTTYIFDRGYVNYGNFREWVQNSILFVARLRAKTRYKVVHERPVPQGSKVIRDADVEILDKVSGQTFQIRLVQFLDETGKLYELVTNRKELTAEDICEIYKCRWQIELFFKWIKQHLKMVHFHNCSEHAVWVQIYIGMITYLLCQLIEMKTQTRFSLWDIIRTLRYYAKDSWESFMAALNPIPTRTSKGRQKKPTPESEPRATPESKTVRIIVDK